MVPSEKQTPGGGPLKNFLNLHTRRGHPSKCQVTPAHHLGEKGIFALPSPRDPFLTSLKAKGHRKKNALDGSSSGRPDQAGVSTRSTLGRLPGFRLLLSLPRALL